MNYSDKEIKFFKKYSIPVNLSDIKSAKLIPNRILEILSEKEISPLLEQEDIKRMNLRDEQHWFNILRRTEEMQVFGENGCLFKVAKWLNVELCDIYGMCFKKSNGNKDADCGTCQSKGRWS
jgi:hypothetical protein